MNKIVILGEESPDAKCDYCGKIDELRPYGKNGAKICYDCGMKPENKAQTEAAFLAVLNGDTEKPSKDQTN
jgi:hypothetical protein